VQAEHVPRVGAVANVGLDGVPSKENRREVAVAEALDGVDRLPVGALLFLGQELLGS
jgi:hypothetical protein